MQEVIIRRKGEHDRRVIVADQAVGDKLSALYRGQADIPRHYDGVRAHDQVTQYDLIRKLFRTGMSVPDIATRLIELGVFPAARNVRLAAVKVAAESGDEKAMKELSRSARTRVNRDLGCVKYYKPFEANYQRALVVMPE